MANREWRRMPNGESTQSVRKYLAAWDVVRKKVMSVFEGYVVLGYDPNITMTRETKLPDGRVRCHSTFSLTMDAVNSIKIKK